MPAPRAGGVFQHLSVSLAAVSLAFVLGGGARAATPDFAPNVAPDPPMRPGAQPGLLCRDAVRRADLAGILPRHLLAGIARVESGRRDPATGRVDPWPWTINAQGQDHIFASKAEAVAFARQLQARGLASFDVGCLQVNLMYHPDAFASLEEAFDPLANATYAVKLLTELHARTGSWEMAAAWYHSANPAEGLPYQGKVATAMAAEAADATAGVGMPPMARVAGTAPMPPPAGFSSPAFSPPAFSPSAFAPSAFVQTAFSARGLPGQSGLAPPGLANPAGPAGRDLNAYRMHPVMVAGARLLAAR